MAKLDIDYDTDTISLASTVQSEQGEDKVYDIEALWSEGWGEDDEGERVKKYLVQWLGYPAHRRQSWILTYIGTWEPEDHLIETGLLEEWDDNKARMGELKFKQYCKKNEAVFNLARKKEEAAHELRQEERARKRVKLKKRKRSRVTAEDSEDDGVPLMQRGKEKAQPQTPAVRSSQQDYYDLFVGSQDQNPLGPPPALEQNASSLFYNPGPVVRKAPIAQSSTEEDESSSGGTTDDSLMGELKAKATKKVRNKKTPHSEASKMPGLGNSILSPESPRKMPSTAITRRPSAPVTQAPPTSNPNSAASGSKSLSKTPVRTPSTASTSKAGAVQAAQSNVKPTASKAITKTGTGSISAIRMTNKPKPPERKWQNSDKLYGKLKSLHRADIISRMEGTPDPSVLEFVGAVPPNLPEPRATNPADNPYGRREAGTRRVREADVEECPQETALSAADSARDWEADKIPLVCPSWRLSNNCPYKAEKCNFLHRNQDKHGRDLPVGDVSGWLPPKYRKPPLTCPYWLMEKFGCKKPDAECNYAHKNTGWMPKDPQNKDVPLQIDPNVIPVTEQLTSLAHKAPERLSANKLSRPRDTDMYVLPKLRKPPRLKPSDLTCWYWTQGKCKNTADTCAFQHHDTGLVADPPPSELTCRLCLSCAQAKLNIERALKVDFEDMFEWGSDEDGTIMVDRRALLLYHPEDHAEELELITRWLLMHHVEVSNAWSTGCWEYFRQHIGKGGSAVVIVIRLWSLGVQEGIGYDPTLSSSTSEVQQHCIEIFPVGGFIYITDDCFEKKPQLALEIFKLFFARIDKLRQFAGPVSPWQEVDDACLLWRLCVRPELMEYLFQRCEAQAAQLDAGDADVTAAAELYTLLSDTKYIEQDSPTQPLSAISDKFPVMSERRVIAEEQPLDYFNTVERSQGEANLRMIQHYAGLQVDMRRDYRHLYVVHTEPFAPCARSWKQEIQSIGDVVSLEQCIKELARDGLTDSEGQLFDFHERHMPKLDNKPVLVIPKEQEVLNQNGQGKDSQMSLEEGEIRATQ
ncbi:hypothetical protein EK21DRAFT_62655 [Setomelanomma holmii]|uniref:Uncharacterized protein n=1 Tax=Setomelanomma holmii TaxID=210430 RepID=A0A9P4HBM6_9PLEO|nr:hypothetical protein EK21DRAFT_62655 [Setomelanomma holmii]